MFHKTSFFYYVYCYLTIMQYWPHFCTVSAFVLIFWSIDWLIWCHLIVTLLVDSDVEQRKSSYDRRKNHQRARSANNHRPAPITTQSSHHSCAVSKQVLQRCHEMRDDRLAEKYNELRSLLLNKLDLTTLTPQVAVLTVLWIGFYHTGPISLCVL